MSTIPMSVTEFIALSKSQNGEFQGTKAQANANRNTHNFGEEGRCVWCDCRDFGVYSSIPCRFWLENIYTTGQISDSFPQSAISTQSDEMEWTDVNMSIHYCGIEGAKFYQVNATRKGTEWFSIQRLDTVDEAIEAFKALTFKVSA